MELHVRALYTHDAAGRLVRVNEQDGAPAPRFFLGRAADGSSVRRYRRDVDDALRRALDAAADADDLDADPGAGPDPAAHAARLARYAAVLARSAPVERTEAGPAFHFPDAAPAAHDAAVVGVTEANADLLHPHLPAWAPDVRRSPPLLASSPSSSTAGPPPCARACASPRAPTRPGSRRPRRSAGGGTRRASWRPGRGPCARSAPSRSTARRGRTRPRGPWRGLALVAYGHTLHLT
jgi:hypothetical protein